MKIINKPQKFAVYIHRLYFDGKVKKGGLDQVLDYLIDTGNEITIFEYPLDYRQTRLLKISRVNKNGTKILLKFKMPLIRDAFSWTLEIFFTIVFSFKYTRGFKFCITSDPLTTLPGVFLKKIGFFKYLYYHSVDYSTDRFVSNLMNRIYFVLLKLGLSNANLVGVVTRKAEEHLKKFGVHKIVFIPNSPSIHSLDSIRLPIEQRQNHSIVITCVSVSHKFLIYDLVKLTYKLSKKYPDIVLNVVGHFEVADPYYSEIQKFINENNIKSNVVFHGSVERNTNYRILAKSSVGLAFYDGMYSHVAFGDAIKIREYCALGLPVVADSHTTTAVEMAQNGCGLIADDFEAAYDWVSKFFDNNEFYKQCAKNSLKWAELNDKDKVMNEIVTKYFYSN